MDGRSMSVEAYLAEMHSLPGFSGSPVFIYIGGGWDYAVTEESCRSFRCRLVC